jgi:hypothetical protein
LRRRFALPPKAQQDGAQAWCEAGLPDDLGLSGSAADDGWLAEAYTSVGNDNDALVIPVGLSFAAAVE